VCMCGRGGGYIAGGGGGGGSDRDLPGDMVRGRENWYYRWVGWEQVEDMAMQVSVGRGTGPGAGRGVGATALLWKQGTLHSCVHK